jgi:hypothetical protein
VILATGVVEASADGVGGATGPLAGGADRVGDTGTAVGDAGSGVGWAAQPASRAAINPATAERHLTTATVTDGRAAGAWTVPRYDPVTLERSPMFRRPLAALAALLIASSLAACSTDAPRNTAGQVTASADTDVFAVKVGDCTGDLTSGEVSEMKLLPCDQAHWYEAYAAKLLTGDDFPGTTELQKDAQDYCTDEFKEFVGVSPSKSDYDYFYLYPTTQTWKTGDREIMCLVGSEKGGVKGSLKGAKK